MGLFGLFDKKKCLVCGSKSSPLTQYKLLDYSYICTDCKNKCSPELHSADFASISPATVKEHIAYKKDNDVKYKNEFKETASIARGSEKWSKKIWAVDEENGWWVNLTYDAPDLFTFKQVVRWEIDIDTSYLTDQDKLRNIDYNSGRPDIKEIPPCPQGKKIDKMRMRIYVEHPWIKTVKIPLIDSNVVIDQKDIENGYAAGEKLVEAFKKYTGK